MKRATLALAIVASALPSARADEPVPPPPSPPQVPAPSPTIDQAQLQRMIDDAVRRTLAATPAATSAAASPQTQAATASPQTQAATASPQSQAATAPPPPQTVTIQYATAPVQNSVTSTAQVLVPPGPIRSALARCGRKLAALDQPRLRTIQLASSQVAASQLITIPAPAQTQTQYYAPSPALATPPTPRK